MTDERHANRGLPTKDLHGPEHDLERRKRILRTARITLIAIGVILCLGLLRILVLYLLNISSLADRAEQNNVMYVQVVSASSGKPDANMTLPSTVESYNVTLVYARTPGYVKEWFKDIGTPVKQGDVLAILETPELNKQVEEAQATFNLSKVVYERWKLLRQEDAVSQQELDEKTSAYKQATANFQRIKELLKFGKIVAPFDGIVSRRNVNVGDLVNSGNGGSAQALFGVSQLKNLHTYVYVPQTRSGSVTIGQEVKIFKPEAPDKIVKGKIAHTAGVIDVGTRTLQVDIRIPDEQSFFLPGSFVEVSLPLDNQDRLVLPTNTLMFGSAGPQVAVVQEGKALRKSVSLGVNYGRSIEITGGLEAGEQVIVNPVDSIANGQLVSVVVPAPPVETAKPATQSPK
ncbi:RND family efflux transporter, MFP subunit [Polynucleobacter meluiroseus]|uniref:RND family efflux transporter, MFP subunit n=1 Tax=Polynucleobacter meluiroseus TaxID=1938814 RepID=A0A240E0G6_9BURK|nr:efflux RND transporter periplasmic adaptor subunit [Polynucleobacter meluiroseus]SNX28707.1 RND family efflux transporter, MFP subunit [Polynucleobacter meluiroseus]